MAPANGHPGRPGLRKGFSLAHRIATTDIRGQFILLGTGTSVGVPVIGCGCAVCSGNDPRNQRLRCAAVVGLPEGVLLIDTPPDLRTQLLRARIGLIHAVAFTHEHADHLYGLDDLRLFQFYLGRAVPIYCERVVEERIRQVYDYAFDQHEPTHPGATPQFDFRTIGTDPFPVLGTTLTPVRLNHGPRFQVLGFRIGHLAYCTDTNEIPAESWPRLEGLETLILDALRHKPHPTHFSLAQAVEVARKVGARQTYFTHVSHDLDHESTNASLPPGMALAYDGLSLRYGDRT
jgi:phosphoribosyl 1,2-cyclic phosphate phosphodiesterase